MSGIVGIVNADGAPIDRDLLRRLTDFLRARGSDASAVWVDGDIGFGHTLLRTTNDTRVERQPASLDNQVCITADARVDGRAELRRQLSGGTSTDPAALTDAELVLHAYRRWDSACVRHLLPGDAYVGGPDQHIAVATRAQPRLAIMGMGGSAFEQDRRNTPCGKGRQNFDELALLHPQREVDFGSGMRGSRRRQSRQQTRERSRRRTQGMRRGG